MLAFVVMDGGRALAIGSWRAEVDRFWVDVVARGALSRYAA